MEAMAPAPHPQHLISSTMWRRTTWLATLTGGGRSACWWGSCWLSRGAVDLGVSLTLISAVGGRQGGEHCVVSNCIGRFKGGAILVTQEAQQPRHGRISLGDQRRDGWLGGEVGANGDFGLPSVVVAH